jgi:hypothetical protein
MPAAVNSWMGFTGLIYLVVGLLLLRKDLGAARGMEKLIAVAAALPCDLAPEPRAT